MANNAILGFRTINKCFMTRWVTESSILVQKPISILIPPTNADIDPGISLGEIKQRNCKGQLQTAFTYKEEVTPKLKLSFDLAGPEIEQMVHGQVVKAYNNVVVPVQFEFDAQETIAGRNSGEHGYQVAAQANGNNTMAYYTDPNSKLSVPLEVVASSPTGYQITIDDHLAITCGATLAATGYRVYGWVNATTPTATAMSATEVGLVGVYLSGIYHDGTVREFRARYCSLEYGTSLGADGKREVNLRILPDANSRSGLGWDVEEIPLQMAC